MGLGPQRLGPRPMCQVLRSPTTMFKYLDHTPKLVALGPEFIQARLRTTVSALRPRSIKARPKST